MKRIVQGATFALLAGAVLMGADDVAAQEYTLRGSEVAVYNLAGEARIVRGSGSSVVVRVDRGGPDAGELEVVAGDIGGGIEALRVIYPADRVVYDAPGRNNFNTTISVRSDGTFGGSSDRNRRDRVEVSSRGRGLEAWADLVIEVPEGVAFELYVGAGEVEAENIRGDLMIDTHTGAVDVRSVVGALLVDTGSGSVTVSDVQGDVSVDTGSGSVDIDGVRGEEIMVDTGSGRVRGAGLAAYEISVDTGSGSIELEDVEAEDVVLDTGSGSVTIELLTDVNDLLIDTGSGSVTVALPESAGAAVEIETGSGGIDLDIPLNLRRASRDHVVGSLGDGRGSIEIDTGSGSIRLVRSRGGAIR